MQDLSAVAISEKEKCIFCVSAYGERETLIALKRSMKGRVTYGECNISWRYPYV